jgi:ribosomal-protein-alanine acetyltransferase
MAREKITAEQSTAAISAMNRIASSAGLPPYPPGQACTLLQNPAIRLFLLRLPLFNAHPVGYLLLQCLPPEGEIFDIAVPPWLQGAGYGSRLLAHGMAHLQHQGCRQCFLEVRESNQTATRFYRRHGFILAGRRRGYYTQPPEDALLLSRTLAGSAHTPFLS